jgi:AraC-like DNA-binding protein
MAIQKTSLSAPQGTPVTTILHSAIAAAQHLVAGDVVFGSDIQQPRDARNGAPRHLYPFPLGNNHHAYPELCLVAHGQAAMRIGETVQPLRPGMLAVIGPGQLHCECARKRTDVYDLVWFVMDSQAEPHLMVSSRGPDGRWTLPLHHPMRASFAQRIADWAQSVRGPLQGENLEALRGLLLAVLGETFLDLAWQAFLAPSRPPMIEQRIDLLRRIKGVLDSRLNQPVMVEALAELFHLSPNYLNHLFRQGTGEPIHVYLTRRRMEIALNLCRDTDLQIKEIAARVGFKDALYFTRAFTRHYGHPPSRLREGPRLTRPHR